MVVSYFKKSLKYLVVFLVFTCSFLGHAQIDSNALFSTPRLTTSERLSVMSPLEGSLVYDTDFNRLFEYTSTGWKEILVIQSTAYPGMFQVSTAGVVTVTGLPFRPSSVTMVAHANVETTTLNADNQTKNNDIGIRNSFGTMNGFARDDNGTITQQVIYIGGHGNSINDISRYASDSEVIGLRYGNQDGLFLGSITGEFTGFTADGFTVNITYTEGSQTNVGQDVLPADIYNEGIVVLFTAYR